MKLLLAQTFDVGVFDPGWPVVDGRTSRKWARSAKPALPMLVLTALDAVVCRAAADGVRMNFSPRGRQRRPGGSARCHHHRGTLFEGWRLTL